MTYSILNTIHPTQLLIHPPFDPEIQLSQWIEALANANGLFYLVFLKGLRSYLNEDNTIQEVLHSLTGFLLPTIQLLEDDLDLNDWSQLQCPFRGCSKKYSIEYWLKSHLSNEHDLKTVFSMTCRKCDPPLTLINKKEYAQHRREEHPDTPITCGKCDPPLILANKKKHSKHQREKHPDTPITCGKCNPPLTSTNLIEYAQHRREKHPDTPIACGKCNPPLTLVNKKEYDQHQRKKHPDTPITCGKCDPPLILSNKKEYAQHQRKKHSDTPITCGKCDPPLTLANQKKYDQHRYLEHTKY